MPPNSHTDTVSDSRRDAGPTMPTCDNQLRRLNHLGIGRLGHPLTPRWEYTGTCELTRRAGTTGRGWPETVWETGGTAGGVRGLVRRGIAGTQAALDLNLRWEEGRLARRDSETGWPIDTL